MIADGVGSSAQVKVKCKNFDKFERNHLKLEGAYNRAYDAAVEALGDADALVFELSHGGGRDVKYRAKRIAALAEDSAAVDSVYFLRLVSFVFLTGGV